MSLSEVSDFNFQHSRVVPVDFQRRVASLSLSLSLSLRRVSRVSISQRICIEVFHHFSRVAVSRQKLTEMKLTVNFASHSNAPKCDSES